MAKQNEFGDEISSVQPLKVPVHKIQLFHDLRCLRVREPQLSYADANAAVLLHFMPVMQTHILAMRVRPRIFLVMF